MLTQSYELSSYHTYSANDKTTIDLPEEGYITRLDCLLTLNITAGTSVSAEEDFLARIIKSCRIKAAGARNFFDISDGRVWYWWNYFKQEGQVQFDSAPDANTAAADYYALFTIHWGYNWRDPFDTTVVIPAVNLSNLQMELEWGAATDLGSGFTVNSGTMKITVYEVTLEPGETEQKIWPAGLINPRFDHRQKTPTSTYSNLGFRDEVPTGDVLYETLVMILDSSDDRTDSDITEIGVDFPKQRRTPISWNWRLRKARSRAHYRVPSDVTGVTLFPWSDVSGREAGIDLVNAQVGDVRMGFTVATANGEINLLHIMMT